MQWLMIYVTLLLFCHFSHRLDAPEVRFGCENERKIQIQNQAKHLATQREYAARCFNAK